MRSITDAIAKFLAKTPESSHRLTTTSLRHRAKEYLHFLRLTGKHQGPPSILTRSDLRYCAKLILLAQLMENRIEQRQRGRGSKYTNDFKRAYSLAQEVVALRPLRIPGSCANCFRSDAPTRTDLMRPGIPGCAHLLKCRFEVICK